MTDALPQPVRVGDLPDSLREYSRTYVQVHSPKRWGGKYRIIRVYTSDRLRAAGARNFAWLAQVRQPGQSRYKRWIKIPGVPPYASKPEAVAAVDRRSTEDA